MFICENEFIKRINVIFQGRANPHIVIASPRLIGIYKEGEYGTEKVRITICHSVQNAAHIQQYTHGASSDHIYMLYASQSGYQATRAVAMTLSVREPASTIIVVVCICDERVKRNAFAQAVLEGKVSYVVFTEDCGAATFMSSIISKLQRQLVSPPSL